METHVKKWGNSLALRIPRPLAEEVGLEENSLVRVMIKEGKLVIVPIARVRYALDALLAEVTPQNLNSEVDTGAAVGGEAW
ncbi:Antitoxin MazE [bacterium HR16]|nr:Antitoxin MazE [bacterium HR16]